MQNMEKLLLKLAPVSQPSMNSPLRHWKFEFEMWFKKYIYNNSDHRSRRFGLWPRTDKKPSSQPMFSYGTWDSFGKIESKSHSFFRNRIYKIQYLARFGFRLGPGVGVTKATSCFIYLFIYYSSIHSFIHYLLFIYLFIYLFIHYRYGYFCQYRIVRRWAPALQSTFIWHMWLSLV